MSKLIKLPGAVEQSSRLDTYIAAPSYLGPVEPETQMCFDSLYQHEAKRRNLVTIPVRKSYGSLIAQNRNNLVKDAISANAKWILFIDTDMVFPENIIELLQKHDVDVVGGVYHSKQPPFVPIMGKKNSDHSYTSITKYPENTLMEVDAVGTGCVMFRMDIFRRIPEPWFAMPAVQDMVVMEEVRKLANWQGDPKPIYEKIAKAYKDVKHNTNMIGEDYYFCHKLQAAGIKIHVDTSLTLGHVGKYVYSVEDFQAMAGAGVFDKANAANGFTDGTEGK